MPSPLAGFHVDVPWSPVVQLVKLIAIPIRATTKRIFIVSSWRLTLRIRMLLIARFGRRAVPVAALALPVF
jgi:hypothetical protein